MKNKNGKNKRRGKVLAQERTGNLVCKEETEVSPLVKDVLFVCL